MATEQVDVLFCQCQYVTTYIIGTRHLSRIKESGRTLGVLTEDVVAKRTGVVGVPAASLVLQDLIWVGIWASSPGRNTQEPLQTRPKNSENVSCATIERSDYPDQPRHRAGRVGTTNNIGTPRTPILQLRKH